MKTIAAVGGVNQSRSGGGGGFMGGAQPYVNRRGVRESILKRGAISSPPSYNYSAAGLGGSVIKSPFKFIPPSP